MEEDERRDVLGPIVEVSPHVAIAVDLRTVRASEGRRGRRKMEERDGIGRSERLMLIELQDEDSEGGRDARCAQAARRECVSAGRVPSAGRRCYGTPGARSDDCSPCVRPPADRLECRRERDFTQGGSRGALAAAVREAGVRVT